MNQSGGIMMNRMSVRTAVAVLIGALVLSQGALAQTPEEPTGTDRLALAIESMKEETIGQDYAIEKLAGSLSEERSVTLLVGPEGTGKTTLARNATLALGLNAVEFDLAKANSSWTEVLAAIGLGVTKEGTDTVILSGIEALSPREQVQLALILQKRKFVIQLPAAKAKTPKPTIVDLSATRFVLITHEGENLFRTPVGFRTSWIHYPDTDAYVREISNERIKLALSNVTLVEPLVDAATTMIPVRRLSAEEYKFAIAETLDRITMALEEELKKPVMIERKEALIEKLFERTHLANRSTFHDLNESIAELLPEELDPGAISPRIRRLKSIVLSWSDETLQISVSRSCSDLLKGEKKDD